MARNSARQIDIRGALSYVSNNHADAALFRQNIAQLPNHTRHEFEVPRERTGREETTVNSRRRALEKPEAYPIQFCVLHYSQVRRRCEYQGGLFEALGNRNLLGRVL